MAARGHMPPSFEGRPIQAPGMLRHGPFPGISPASHHHPLESLPSPEFLEKKIGDQGTEIERIARENQRLAESHGALRQELFVAQQEMQRVQAHVGSVHTESDIQIRGLLERIGKLEADIRAGEMVKKELQQAHLEAQSLLIARQELTAEIQLVTEELQKSSADIKKLPEMHAELDEMRQEHQKLRVAFEYEKGSNLDQVERLQAMEKNMISMAREVEKLNAQVENAEKRAGAPNPYGGSYGSPNPVYPPSGQGGSYPDRGYGQGGGYGHAGGYNAGGYGQGGVPASYSNAYVRPQAQMTGGAAADGMHSYGGAGGASYSDGYGRSQVPMAGAASAGEAMNPYGASSGGPYEAARGAPMSARR